MYRKSEQLKSVFRKILVHVYSYTLSSHQCNITIFLLAKISLPNVSVWWMWGTVASETAVGTCIIYMRVMGYTGKIFHLWYFITKGLSVFSIFIPTRKCGRWILFGHVCLCLCILCLCPVLALTFETLDLETSFLVCRLAVWLSVVMLWSRKQTYSTSGTINTGFNSGCGKMYLSI